MLSPKMRKLEEAKALVAELELAVAAELASLHMVYGFVSVDEFIVAVGASKRGKGPGRPKKAKVAKKTRRRAKITDATRAKVKAMVKAGETGAGIAKAVGISLPSVQNIKKALGLVRSKKSAATKPAAPKKAKKAPKMAKAKTPPKPKKKSPKATKAAEAPAPEPAPTPAAAPVEIAPPAAT